ncbi:MAG: hypothetical protein GEU93_20515 [Propionibacteriales bacterium]|nr:hypothetical protein [Propionibacteriales bacterium]
MDLSTVPASSRHQEGGCSRVGVAAGRWRVVVAGAAALLVCGFLLTGGAVPASAQTDQTEAAIDVSAAPRTLLFGDQLRVRAEVVVDPELADPDSVELDTEFRPFEVEEIRRAAEHGSDLSAVRFTITLRCLSTSCLPPEDSERREFEFPPLRVRVVAEGEERTFEAPVPRVQVQTRLRPSEVSAEDGWSYDDRTLAPFSHAIAPGSATALLWIGAGGLVLLGGALTAYAITGRGPRAALAATRRTPLERALALARRAASQDPEVRRRALERLARELSRAGHPDLAERSGALAWSPPEPPGIEMGALLADVEYAEAGR